MKLYQWLFVAGSILLASGIVARAEEGAILGSIVLVAGVVVYVTDLMRQVALGKAPSNVERRLAELEARIALTEGELESVTGQLERVKAGQDFDRLLTSAADVTKASRRLAENTNE
jgi:hypothetical protein